MLSELAKDDVPDLRHLMSIRIADLSATDRRLVGLDSQASPDDTIGGYCFTAALPHQLVAARFVRYIHLL